MKNYDNIINATYTPKCIRASMSGAKREAQFAPFAALAGFDDVIDTALLLYDCEGETRLTPQPEIA